MSLVVLPRQFVTNINGEPLVGAKAYVYDATTTTLRAVYPTAADAAAETNALPNPVESVSTGLFPAIYVNTEGGPYKLVITTAAGATIYTEDNILGILSSQADIGAILYPPTLAEGGSVVNAGYPYGYIRRYGNTLNSETFQTALTVNAGKTVYIAETDTVTITDTVVMPINTHLAVVGKGYATLDGSAATGTLLTAWGTLSAALGGGLASSVAKGAYSITLNSAPSVSAGDWLIIHNPADGSFNLGKAEWRAGDSLIIKSISGTTVTFTECVEDDFPDTCVVYKVTSTNTCIGKLRVIGNTAGTVNAEAISVRYARDSVIEEPVFENTTASCLEINTAYHCRAEGVRTGKYLDDSGSLESSGVLVAASKHCLISHCDLYAARHAASTGGGSMVTDRFNLFWKCNLSSKHGAAADNHGNVDRCKYVSCRIDGLITLSGKDCEVYDCDVYAGTGRTTLVQFLNAVSIGAKIKRNRFYLRGNGNVVEANDAIDISADTTQAGFFDWDDNEIIDDYIGNVSYLVFVNQGSTAEMRWSFTRTKVRKSDTTHFGNLLSMSVSSGSAFDSLTLGGEELINAGYGIVSGVQNININPGIVRMPSLNGAIGSFTCTANGSIVAQFDVDGFNGRLLLAGTSTSNLTLKPSKIFGGVTTIRALTVNTFKDVYLQDPDIGSAANPDQTRAVDVFSVQNLKVKGGRFRGAGGLFIDSTVTGVEECEYEFDVDVDLATPATAFTLYTVPTNCSAVPLAIRGRLNTDVTATTGNFWAAGNSANDRRADYGVCTIAAASSKHLKNSKLRFINSSERGNQMLDSGEVLSLLSVTTTADNAAAGSNIGGASQTASFSIALRVVGPLPDAP